MYAALPKADVSASPSRLLLAQGPSAVYLNGPSTSGRQQYTPEKTLNISIGRRGQHGRCVNRRQVLCQAALQANVHIGSLSSNGLRFGVVVARFNELVTKPLLEGVLEGLERHGTIRDEVQVAWVPGSFEMPVVAKAMAKSGKFDAVITVGAVVRGATAHFDAVVGAATSGVLSAGLDAGVPVIFCVMTTDTMEQALDRAGGKAGNKGYEAAVTAIETANVLRSLGQQGFAAPGSNVQQA
ncbi:g9870 [Coccomyxa viridis]|uniref:6,7-dimethyl-8-ribityllumazine synthase n=1 Tax=Coccomyxa viridis TaxID=1274662 RepID=A0ABP1G4D9_9CHLO